VSEDRSRSEGLFERIECFLCGIGPFELCVLALKSSEGCCNLPILLDESSIEIGKAEEDLNDVSEEIDRRLAETTLLSFSRKAMLAKAFQNLLDVSDVLFSGFAVYHDIDEVKYD
jgi:hypothetical protein